MNKQLSEKSSVIQLAFLGFVALSIGILCMLDIVFVYNLPALTSISESATTGNQTGMLLPFALGCMFTYCIAYVGYCRSEQIITRVMGIGFAVVALQICESNYVTEERVGLLGLPPEISQVLHGVGAIVGFGAMFIWIMFYFTRKAPRPTREKRIRNKVYWLCGGMMFSGIILFVLGMFGTIGTHYVFIAEEFLLIPAGIALLVKSGLFLKDKPQPQREKQLGWISDQTSNEKKAS